MASIDTAPPSVQGWFAAQAAGDAEALAAVLALDVVLTFAGRRITGPAAVVAHVRSMPSRGVGAIEWQVLPGTHDRHVTIRGTGPGGAPMPSPGGPMSAMDFAFDLNEQGLISSVSPHPHHTEPRDLPPVLPLGATAPAFVLPDVTGNPVPLRDNDSEATVVIFTCNPCPWALGWHERLQRVIRDYANKGVRVLQINANDPAASPKDSLEDSRRRVDTGQFAGPYLIDEGQQVARAWGARHTPDVFVLNADGIVAYHGAPDADVDEETLEAGWLRAALDAVLAGTTPDPASTTAVGCTIKWTLG
jgi:peroxiredoxin